jgi:hypothetical protein
LASKLIARGDKLGLANAAVVFHTRAAKPKGAKLDQGWLSFNFGLAYNQTQGFDNSIGYSGTNPKNSIADYFAESATIFMEHLIPFNRAPWKEWPMTII